MLDLLTDRKWYRVEYRDILQQEVEESLVKDASGFGRLASELPLNILKIPSQNLSFLQRSLLNSS